MKEIFEKNKREVTKMQCMVDEINTMVYKFSEMHFSKLNIDQDCGCCDQNCKIEAWIVFRNKMSIAANVIRECINIVEG